MSQTKNPQKCILCGRSWSTEVAKGRSVCTRRTLSRQSTSGLMASTLGLGLNGVFHFSANWSCWISGRACWWDVISAGEEKRAKEGGASRVCDFSRLAQFLFIIHPHLFTSAICCFLLDVFLVRMSTRVVWWVISWGRGSYSTALSCRLRSSWCVQVQLCLRRRLSWHNSRC